MYKIGSYIPTSEKGANDGVAQLDASGKLLSSQVSLASTTISTDVIFTDSRTTKKGLEYAADYSATFTARSLVDKAYVDANSGGSSIYTSNGTIGTGRIATLTDTLTIKGGTSKFEGENTLSTSSALQIYDGDSTPALLWDFRNNGDVFLLKETTIRSDFQEMLTLESSASNPSLVLNALNSGSNTNIEFAKVNSKKWLIGNVSSNDSFRIFNYQNLTTPISISNANKINILAPTTTT